MHHRSFIGRQSELQQLHQLYEEAENGNGKIVLIEGPAGIGKSGLIREFFRQIEKQENVLTSASECNDKEDLNAYAPFKDILLDLNAQTATLKSKLSKDEKLKKLKQFVTEAGTGWIGLIPVVGSFASTGIDTYKAFKSTYMDKSGPDVQSEQDIYRIFENEFRRLTQKHTIVIFIDDLQWADASSLNLLFALGKSLRANPYKIIIIGSYRHNEIKAGRNKITETGEVINIRHPFADKLNELRNYQKKESHISSQHQWFVEIAMHALSERETADLINAYFPDNSFPADFSHHIFDLTDGHPLYLVEILDYLYRNDMIVEEEGQFLTRNIDIKELPVSVNAIINEKVERLDKELRKVLSYASVNGEKFAVQVVEKILKIDELDLLDYLEELSQRHGLLIAGKPVKVKDMLMELYSFSQTLVHKFIYENMDGARRRALHRRIAETIKTLYGESLETDKELRDQYNLHMQIGQGLIDGISLQINKEKVSEEGTSGEQSSMLLDAALSEVNNAKEKFELFAMEECIDHVNKALAFLSTVSNENKQKLSIQFEALRWKNKALQWQGHYRDAFEAAEKMKATADKMDGKKETAIALIGMGKADTFLGNSEIAIPYIREAIEILESSDDQILLWEAHSQMGQTKHTAGLYDDAIAFYKKAIGIASSLDERGKKAENILSLGFSYAKKSEYDIAISNYNEALEIFQKLDNHYQIGQVYNRLGLALQNKAHYADAGTYFEKALHIAEEQNDLVNISNRVNNIALNYESQGDYQSALIYYKKTLAIDRQLDDKPMMVKSLNNIAMVYIEMFNFDKAMELFKESIIIAESLNDKIGLADTYSFIGHAYIPMNKTDLAIEYLQKALDIDLELGNKSSMASNYVGMGNAYKTAGEFAQAAIYYRKAGELYQAVNDRYSISLVNNNLGAIDFSEGNFQEAAQYYLNALEYALEVNDKMNESLIKGNLANCYHKLGDHKKGVQYHTEAIDIATNIGEKGHLSNHYNSLALEYYNAGLYDKAIATYEGAVKVNISLNRKITVGENYRDIADAYRQMEKWQEAINAYSSSLEYVSDEASENKDLLLDCYFYLGNCYFNLNDEKKAADFHLKALQLQLEVYGENTTDTALFYNNLGSDYYWMENYTVASDYLLKAYNIRKNLLGLMDENTEFSRNLLARAYYYANKEGEAYPYFKESLEYYQDAGLQDSDQFKHILEYVQSIEKTPAEPDQDIDSINQQIQDHFTKGIEAFEAKDYDNSIREHQEALMLQQKVYEPNSKYIGNSFYRIALAYFSLQNSKKAIENFNNAYRIYIENFGEQAELPALCLEMIGCSHYVSESYSTSNEFYQKALGIYTVLDGGKKEKMAECHRFLGLNNQALGKPDQALQHWQNAYQFFVEVGGEESYDAGEIKDFIESLSSPASQNEPITENNSRNVSNELNTQDTSLLIEEINHLIEQGKKQSDAYHYQEALPYFEQAYEKSLMLSEADETLELKYHAKFNLASINQDLKNYEKALELFYGVLNYAINIYGNESFDTARAYSNIGDIYSSQRLYDKAITNHTKALETYTAVYGKEESLVAWAYYDLGMDHLWSKKYNEAISYFSSAMEIRTILYGEKHADVANCNYWIGITHASAGNFEEAIRSMSGCYEIRKSVSGRKTEETDRALFELGRIYFSAGKTRQAKNCFSNSLKIRKKLFGSDSDEYKRAEEWLRKI